MDGFGEGITLKTLITYINSLGVTIAFNMRKINASEQKHLSNAEIIDYQKKCGNFLVKEFNKSSNPDIEVALIKYIEKLKKDNLNVDDMRKIISEYIPLLSSYSFTTYVLNENMQNML